MDNAGQMNLPFLPGVTIHSVEDGAVIQGHTIKTGEIFLGDPSGHIWLTHADYKTLKAELKDML